MAKTGKHRIHWPLLARINTFLADRAGSVLVEAAVVFPILVTLLMGGIEAGRYIMLEQKLSRIASNAGDLVARAETFTAADVNQVFASVSYIVKPFSLDDQGLVVISSVTRPTGVANPQVTWQYEGAGSASKTSQIGIPGGSVTLPGTLTLAEGDTVIVAEIFYDYQPFFVFGLFFDSREIHHQAFYRPRFGAS